MKVEEVSVLEDCFDGSLVREFRLDTVIDEHLVRRLGRLGALQYFPSFARPFFRVDEPSRYCVQGIVGSQTLRATFCRGGLEQSLDLLTQAIEVDSEASEDST